MAHDALQPDARNQIAIDPVCERSRLRALNDFAIELLAIPTRDDLLWHLAREVVGRLGFVDCVIYQLEADRAVIRQVAAIGEKNPRGTVITNTLEIPVGEGITGTVARSGKAILVDDLQEDDRYIQDLVPARSELCVPLIIDGEAVGVIDCEHPEPGYFGPGHLELLSTIAAMASAKLKLIDETRRAGEQSDDLQRLNLQLNEEILQRGRIEDRLRKSEERFRSVIDNSPSAILLKDLDGRFRLVNRRFKEWFGVSDDHVIDKTAHEAFSRVRADRHAEMDQQVIETGEVCERELELTFADGTHHLVLVTKFPVTRPDGVLDGVGTIARDITERKSAEEKLRTSEERLRQATKLAKIGYYVWDAVADRCLFCSEEHARIHGLSPEQYIARASVLDGTFSLTHPEDRETVRAAMKALRAGEAIEIEYRSIAPDGTVCHVREVAKPVLDAAGRVVQEIGSSQDITEMKLAEERLRQAQKMEAVGQLTGGVAHDFNNLLAVIKGNGELLADPTEDLSELRDQILAAAERGAALTQRLLSFSRQQPLRPQPLDLAEVVSGMSELIDRTLGRTINVTTSVEPGLCKAMADRGQLENALLNLAINARDAMPRGGRLTIACGQARLEPADPARDPDALPGDYVVLAISDTGTGMSAAVLEHVFEPFFTTKGPGEGSGLGLSMVYGFAKQSGGHVSIHSEEGRGTTVKIHLPRVAAAAERETTELGGEIPLGRGELVLVIEDDADVRALAVKMLHGLGYRTIDVPETVSAREVLDRGVSVDLVLSDVILTGGASGPQFASEIKAVRPALKVVFMSGYPLLDARHGSALRPGDVLLGKPFSREQLARTLRDALD